MSLVNTIFPQWDFWICLIQHDLYSCCLPSNIHHSHLRRKAFFFFSLRDTSPLVSRYADISSVSPLSCFMISVLYRVKGVRKEKGGKKRKKYNLYLYSSSVLFHSRVLDSHSCYLSSRCPLLAHILTLLFGSFSQCSSLFSRISLFILHMWLQVC